MASFWSKFVGKKKQDGFETDAVYKKHKSTYDPSRYAVVDIETGVKDHKIHDIGALR